MNLRLVTCFFALILPFQLSASYDPDLLEGLKARNIGPAAVGGRITAIDAVNSNPDHIVIGTATGGAWISDNGGLTWEPVFDDQPVASIGSVAINQQNPDIIWIGTGEGNVRNSTSIGDGMFKSVDGGKTWQRAGLQGTERIRRIALHPDNPEIAYAAALGTLWGENSERGIYKTTDGGATWTKILYTDEKTGGTDIKIDPFNPQKLYASLWQHRRWPWHFKSGGPGSAMYISWDAGATWTQKTQEDGLPEGELGRITFSPSPARKDRVYALVEAEKSAMLRSDDGGRSWMKVNQDTNIANRPFYYNEVLADPQDANTVYNIFTFLSVSIDGGRTFETNPVINCCAASNTVHIDNHALWINPEDSSHLIIGNDGGIAISHDRGATWRFVRNLPLSQFYHVAVDNAEPYNVYGGLQDNGSWRGPAEVRVNAGIRNLHWQEVGFGDGFDTLADPENPRRGYSMSQTGYLYNWNLDTGEGRLIRPSPPQPGVELRFNWDSALAQDPFDAATIYYGSQFVHKSTDRGLSWTTISPDLTSNDPERQTYKESGGLTPDVSGAENNTTLTVIAPSPLDQGLIWTGSDDGRIHVTRDGGENWTRIDERARGVAAGAWVQFIAASPHQAGTAFIAIDDHRRSDMTAYFYKVEDYGRRWTRLGEDLPGYALSILQDHEDPDLLFAGTEFGLHFSTDGGASWSAFRAGVPTVSVMDMAIQQRENDLVLGTHGRGIFVIDDYSALRALDESTLEKRLAILSATEGLQYMEAQTPSTRFTGSGEFRADNEPFGVILTFVASGEDLAHPDEARERARKIARRNEDSGNEDAPPAKPARLKIEVSNAQGEVIRTFTSDAHQGINRLAWNLRADGVRGMPGPEPADPGADLPSGPRVVAGNYTVTMTLGEGDGAASDSMEVTVVADARTGVSMADRSANFAASLEVQELQTQAVEAVERIIEARKDLDVIDQMMARRNSDGDDAEDESIKALKEQSGELRESLNELEKKFRTPPGTKGSVYSDHTVSSQIGMAAFYVASTLQAPSPTALGYIDNAKQVTNSAVSEVDTFFAEQVAPFRTAVEEAEITLLSASQ